MSDSESKVKVTDKRMFTPEGELREDFRHLEDEKEEKEEGREERPERAAPATEPPPRGPVEPAGTVAESPPGASPPGPAIVDPATGEEPASGPGPAAGQPDSGAPGEPGFLDLVSLLAQPIPLYLGDAQLEGEGSMENLDAARFYIDMLEVLKEKTEGNLSAEESALLEDLLYRLRLRYVQKTR